jgi:hypothetical protein
LALAALLLACLASGCDSSGVGRTLPVAGKVFFDGKPWTAKTTIILFKPDASKGNTSPFEPIGTVDDNGNYSVKTKDRSGAPPGHYKVVVSALTGDPVHPNAPGPHRPVAESLLPSRYGEAASSPLAVEVKDDAAEGAYDLKMVP